MPKLVEQIREAVEAFAVLQTPPALIGGLALAAHRVILATRDIDFLVDAEDAERLHSILSGLGYRCVHQSPDAANYLRAEEGLDVLFARRPEARQLLRNAPVRRTPLGALRVVDAEGLIGFKLQALANDPSRTRDLDDIRALQRNNAGALDMLRVRRNFQLFEREALWMNSSPHNALRHPMTDADPPLAASAGVPFRADPEVDPIAAWLDLMEAVEALCPSWPPIEPRTGEHFRL